MTYKGDIFIGFAVYGEDKHYKIQAAVSDHKESQLDQCKVVGDFLSNRLHIFWQICLLHLGLSQI